VDEERECGNGEWDGTVKSGKAGEKSQKPVKVERENLSVSQWGEARGARLQE
jgi:hypothetical protein